MGFFSWIADKISDAKDWIVDKIDDVKDFLFRKKYDDKKVSDQVDVDKVLVKFHDDHKVKINEAEEKCMNEVNDLFQKLLDETEKRDIFSDLVTIIKYYQQQAEWELDGTINSYVREHLSKNDPDFVEILKMKSSPQKKINLDNAFENTYNDALRLFYSRLIEYAEKILTEFDERLSSRICDQEEKTNQQIKELEKIMAEAEANLIDTNKLEDEYAPAMEASECIIAALTKAVNV